MRDMTLQLVWRPETQQRVFRALMDAFARPGEAANLAVVSGEGEVALLVLATLLDGQVTLADTAKRLSAHDLARLEARPALAEDADFILANGADSPSFTPRLGTLESPERGATLLIVVESLDQGGMALTLRGPGIVGKRTMTVAGLHPDWLARREAWNSSFPLGVEWLLTDGRDVVAMPRTTQVTLEGAL